jgi:hypothetical protein
MTCDTCKYWEQFKWMAPPLPTQRRCLNPKLDSGDIDGAKCSYDTSDILTSGKFGCIHHENTQ